MHGSCEYVVIEIYSNIFPSKSCLLACLYRPPDSDLKTFNEQLLPFLELATKKPKKLVIVAGDFNINLLKASTHLNTSHFLNILTSTGFFL